MRKSKAHAGQPKLSSETINLIKEMAKNDRLWGAERIRGELLKLDIRVSKRTIQKYMKQIRPKRAREQSWKTFLRNHVPSVPSAPEHDSSDKVISVPVLGGLHHDYQRAA